MPKLAEIAKLPDSELQKLTAEEIKELLDQQLKINKRTRDARDRMFPHLGWEPNPPQRKWALMIDEGVRSRRHYDYGALWGTWTGKTTFWVNMVASLVWGGNNFFASLELFRNFGWTDKKNEFHPFPKHIRLGCTSKQMMQFSGTIWREIKAWWPKDKSWKAHNQGLAYPSAFELPNGWTMEVMAFDRDESVKESDTIGIYITDEPPPMADWDAAAGRRKKGGIRLMHGTMVLRTPDAAQLYEALTARDDCEFMMARVEDNFKSNGGFLDDEITIEMMRSWNEAERETRATGKPVFLSGTAFDLTDDVHFIPRDRMPDKGVTIGIADPHPNKPWAITIGRVDSWGDRYVIDEWPKPSDYGGQMFHAIQKDTHGVGHFASVIRRLDQKWGCAFWVIDARFAASQARENDFAITLRNKLWTDYQLRFVDGNKTVGVDGGTGSMGVLQEMLQYDKTREVDYGNHPKLRIINDLKNVRYQMLNVAWDERGKLTAKLEDFPRSLMYFVMADHRAYAPKLQARNDGIEWTPEQLDRERKELDRVKNFHPEWSDSRAPTFSELINV